MYSNSQYPQYAGQGAPDDIESDPFVWYPLEEPLGPPVTIDRKVYKAVFTKLMIRNKDKTACVKLPELFDGFVVSKDDLTNRVDDDSWEDACALDLQARKPSCKFWTEDGEDVSDVDFQKTRLAKTLADPNTDIDWYRKEWILCFTGAVEIIANQTSWKSALDWRFYEPTLETRLFIRPEKPLERVSDEAISAAFKIAGELSEKVIPQLLPRGQEPANHIRLSTNPLGLYSTWVEEAQLDDLIEKQTWNKKTRSWSRWIKQFPSGKEVQDLNNQMLLYENKQPRGDRFDAFTPDTTESLFLDSMTVGPHVQRRSPELYMGKSASKWAKEWSDFDAEWLHLIAHRFDKANGDRFGNIIFGTKECNTDMMRTEAAVDHLLRSGKVYAVNLQTRVDRAQDDIEMIDLSYVKAVEKYKSTFDDKYDPKPEAKRRWRIQVPGYGISKDGQQKSTTYPHWIAPSLRYSLVYYFPAQNNYERRFYTNFFFPFSRQRPFYFETKLDKALLDIYLGYITKPNEQNLEPTIKKILQDRIQASISQDFSNIDSQPSDDRREERAEAQRKDKIDLTIGLLMNDGKWPEKKGRLPLKDYENDDETTTKQLLQQSGAGPRSSKAVAQSQSQEHTQAGKKPETKVHQNVRAQVAQKKQMKQSQDNGE